MVEKNKTAKKHLRCPYCDEEIYDMHLPICSACHVEVLFCRSCKEPLPKNAVKCPKCGASLKGKS